MVARSFPTGGSGLNLHVLDSTDPAVVGRVIETVPAEHTLFVASSKSGEPSRPEATSSTAGSESPTRPGSR